MKNEQHENLSLQPNIANKVETERKLKQNERLKKSEYITERI